MIAGAIQRPRYGATAFWRGSKQIASTRGDVPSGDGCTGPLSAYARGQNY